MFKKPLWQSVDPDQTAPIGAVCPGSTLFASILNLSGKFRQLFAADDFSRRHFQMHFFLGALRVNQFPEVVDIEKPQVQNSLKVYFCSRR